MRAARIARAARTGRSPAIGARLTAGDDRAPSHGARAPARSARARYDSAAGVVAISLFVDGGWRTVVTDDRVPCDTRARAPLYARALDPSSAWVALLEKAVAKLFGSYEAISGGNVGYALRLLSGGHARELPLPPAAAKAAGAGSAPTAAATADFFGAISAALARGALVAAVPGGSVTPHVPGGFGGLRTMDGGLWRGRAYAVVAVAGAAAGSAGSPAGEPDAGPASGAWLRLENRFAPEHRCDGVWEGARKRPRASTRAANRWVSARSSGRRLWAAAGQLNALCNAQKRRRPVCRSSQRCRASARGRAHALSCSSHRRGAYVGLSARCGHASCRAACAARAARVGGVVLLDARR